MHVDELAGRSTLREMVCWPSPLVGCGPPLYIYCIASRSFNFELAAHTRLTPRPRRRRRGRAPPAGGGRRGVLFLTGRRPARGPGGWRRGVLHNPLLSATVHSSYTAQTETTPDGLYTPITPYIMNKKKAPHGSTIAAFSRCTWGCHATPCALTSTAWLPTIRASQLRPCTRPRGNGDGAHLTT